MLRLISKKRLSLSQHYHSIKAYSIQLPNHPSLKSKKLFKIKNEGNPNQTLAEFPMCSSSNPPKHCLNNLKTN